jgi:hypothetical protein
MPRTVTARRESVGNRRTLVRTWLAEPVAAKQPDAARSRGLLRHGRTSRCVPRPARIPPTAWRESGDDRDTGRCDEAEQARAVPRGEGAEKRAENLGTYWAQMAAENRCRPVLSGRVGTACVSETVTTITAKLQVRRQMRTSGPTSASMLGVPAGVAQLAEQPSCKQPCTLPLTWLLAEALTIFGRHSAHCPLADRRAGPLPMCGAGASGAGVATLGF